jgi:hypothetical protein
MHVAALRCARSTASPSLELSLGDAAPFTTLLSSTTTVLRRHRRLAETVEINRDAAQLGNSRVSVRDSVGCCQALWISEIALHSLAMAAVSGRCERCERSGVLHWHRRLDCLR